MIINNINFIWYIIWSLKSTFKNNYHFGGICRLTSTVTVDLIEHDDVNGPAHILVRKRVSGTCVCVFVNPVNGTRALDDTRLNEHAKIQMNTKWRCSVGFCYKSTRKCPRMHLIKKK